MPYAGTSAKAAKCCDVMEVGYMREIQLIRTEHTSLIPAEKQKKKVNGRDYQKALKRAWRIAELSLMANAIQAVMIWLLQAGPIW